MATSFYGLKGPVADPTDTIQGFLSEALTTTDLNRLAAADSADRALASENAAAASEGNASTSETNAANSAAASANSATNSLNSANASATSASNASTSETNAATSETNAATSASNASTSETNAANSAAAAATTLANAAPLTGATFTGVVNFKDGTGAVFGGSAEQRVNVFSNASYTGLVPRLADDSDWDWPARMAFGNGSNGSRGWFIGPETTDDNRVMTRLENDGRFAPIASPTVTGKFTLQGDSFELVDLIRDVGNGYRVKFNMNADGSQFAMTFNGSADTSYIFEPGLLTTPSFNSSVITKRMGEAQYVPKSGTVRVVAEHVLFDDVQYSTGSQSYVTYKTYLIEETVPDSRLIVSYSAYLSPNGGDNGDAGQDNLIACVDASGITWTIGVPLRSYATHIFTTNATSDSCAHFSSIMLKMPELPQAAKTDLTPFGGSGMGWRIICQHSENYNCTAKTQLHRLHYREITND